MVNGYQKINVAVLGSASASENSADGKKAFRIGQLVSDGGAVLLTGGCPGLPHAAVMGASSRGGLTVAVSPAMNRQEHVERYRYPMDSAISIFTGSGTKGRNVILVRSADACVFVGGGIGTLNEFTIAVADLTERCAIGILTGSGGISDELHDILTRTGASVAASMVYDSDPDRLMKRLFDHLTRWLRGLAALPENTLTMTEKCDR